MGSAAAPREDSPMSEITRTSTGRAPHNPTMMTREARRLVGFERHYHCASCGHDTRSWSRAAACPDCGEAYVSAVIRRAAFAG